VVAALFAQAEKALDIDEFVIPRVFLAIAVIIVSARLMGALFKKLRQPAVVGEIVGGILLGPTLLGQFGNADTELFPLEIRPFLKVVANLGLVIFMFIVGMELDLKLIRGKERQAGVISLSSIVLPFALGLLLALHLHDAHATVPDRADEVPLLPFALFIGASMSITAFPVLARILTDRGMYRTQIGALTLACAAVDDILAWTLLAVVLAIVETGTISGHFVEVMVEALVFVAFMFIVVRPQLKRLDTMYRKAGRLTPNILAIIVVGFLLCAFITSKIGIHHIFGAFVFGAIMPREGTHHLFHEIVERLENVSVLLLLPVFFVATGLNVSFDGLHASSITTLVLILITACVGKFVGAMAGARAQGIPTRKAAAIGTLMNTRGLTELIILSIGREKGVLDPELFTLLVVMAVFTTVITEPVLRVFYPDKMLNKDVADAERASLGIVDAYRVLVPIVGDDPQRAAPLVDVAVDFIGDESPAELVLSRLSRQSAAAELGAGLGGQLADIAASMDALRALQYQADTRGVRSAVYNQASVDPVGDWIHQVETLAVDLVVLEAGAGPPELVPRMLAEAQCDVVVVADPSGAGLGTVRRPTGTVLVTVGGGRHRAAALELAVRAARAEGATVTMVELDDDGRASRRRLTQLGEQVEALGLGVRFGEGPTAVSDHLDTAALFVVAHDAHGQVVDRLDRAACVVRAKDGFERPRLSEVFKDLPAPGSTARKAEAAVGPIIDESPPIQPSTR
jgi:Kef-type K+ transport system membrane component KefB